jgi:hypothetical protein
MAQRTDLLEQATMAGMMLGRLDSRRSAIICTPDTMRGKVRLEDLRVPRSELSRSVGGEGARLVAWFIRGRVAGVVWADAGRVRYTEGRPQDLLPADVRSVMHAEGWD